MNYYYVQNAKTKEIFKKYDTFEKALNFIQTHKHSKYDFEILATEIDDGYNGKIGLYNGEKLYKILDVVGDYIEIDGGRWIKHCQNGKYHLNGNVNIAFGEVFINCYDGNAECIESNLIGYIQL